MQDLALDLSIIKLEIIVKITHLSVKSEKQIENVADKILKRCIHALLFTGILPYFVVDHKAKETNNDRGNTIALALLFVKTPQDCPEMKV